MHNKCVVKYKVPIKYYKDEAKSKPTDNIRSSPVSATRTAYIVMLLRIKSVYFWADNNYTKFLRHFCAKGKLTKLPKQKTAFLDSTHL